MGPAHLIIVCCHAIWLGGPTAGDGELEWLLEDFQKEETPTFIEHIKRGIQVLAADPDSILVFSGGPTKPSLTQLAEAKSYLSLAMSRSLFGLQPLEPNAVPLRARIFTDTFATDSYQNLLFPLLQLDGYVSQVHGQDLSSLSSSAFQIYSPRVTVVTHHFKRERFLGLHGPALKLSSSKLEIIGIDPPMDEAKRLTVEEGEQKRAVLPWGQDPYGVGELLAAKRKSRGWTDEREAMLAGSVKAGMLRDLLRWKGGETGKEIFPGHLPWE